ncbi:penicillin acylase family protein [Dactylosporangium cerinum]|uniref:Penicillin acylase family protein n=1 Tax=Dactylosporangium cerinum TaxID=1434730 RepID=A0ABV9VTZ6_9ACTN
MPPRLELSVLRESAPDRRRGAGEGAAISDYCSLTHRLGGGSRRSHRLRAAPHSHGVWLAQRAGGERRGRPLGVCRQCGDSWRPAVHADDRLFQMDVTRRQTSGTLAELLGASAIPSDVQMHTIGLRRAAARGLPAQSPPVRDNLQAYADGVNAFTARHAPPAQYARPWTDRCR